MNLLQGLGNMLSGQKQGQSGRLQVTVVEARKLARKDFLSKSDPYCLLSVGGRHDLPFANHIGTHVKTTVINNNQDPVWNQTFTLNVRDSENELLRIKCYDYDHATFDDLIGEVDVPLFNLIASHPKDEWYQLSPAKGGSIRLIITAQGFGMQGQHSLYPQQISGHYPPQQFQQYPQQQYPVAPHYPPGVMAPPVAYPMAPPIMMAPPPMIPVVAQPIVQPYGYPGYW